MCIASCSKANEDLQQQISELHGKLQVKVGDCLICSVCLCFLLALSIVSSVDSVHYQVTENGRLEDDAIELRGELEMANLLVQQVRNKHVCRLLNAAG